MIVDWNILIVIVPSFAVGFSAGMFYANITYIRYKKTVDSITRHKSDKW